MNAWLELSRLARVTLALALVFVWACEAEVEPQPRVSAEPSPTHHAAAARVHAASPQVGETVTKPEAVLPRMSLDLPDRCDRLFWRETEAGPQLSKERPTWLRKAETRRAHQAELAVLIEIVAAELGADATAAEMIWRKAIYESSGNAGNVHVRTKDLEANRAAAGKGRRRATARWRRAKVPVYRKWRGRVRKAGSFDAWALGRGLFGQVTGLHMHRWSADAPPWSLCDPVVATVTVIWAMRAGLAECKGTTLRDAYRRFSSGKCEERTPGLEARFDRLARGRVRGLELEPFDPDAPAVLGSRWPEDQADRELLLGVVWAKLDAAGIALGREQERETVSPKFAPNPKISPNHGR